MSRLCIKIISFATNGISLSLVLPVTHALSVLNVLILVFFKGATKLYFTHYSCVVIILLITDLYKSAFSIYSLGNQFFCLSALFVLTACSDFDNSSWTFLKHLYNNYLRSRCKLMDWFLYDNGLRHERVIQFAISIIVVLLWGQRT